MRIVQVIPHSFLPPKDGGRLRTAGLATALARLGELHILSLDDDHLGGGGADSTSEIDLPFGGKAHWHDLRAFSARSRAPRNALLKLRHPGLPWAFRPGSPREAAMWARLEALAPDVVVADDTRFAPFAVGSRARRRIVSTHNVESRLWQDLAEAEPEDRRKAREADRYARLERLFPRADQVWSVRPEDVESYVGLGVARERLHLVPNTLPLSRFAEAPRAGRPGEALYVGSLWYGPNADAAMQLLDLAETSLRDGRAERFRIVGGGAPEALAARAKTLPNVDLLGFVEDLHALLADCAAVLIPLRAGGGTKLKTLEALAAGKPLLTTPCGAEGLDLQDGIHALIRDPGPSFAEAAKELLARPEAYQAMALAGQAHARHRFSQEALETAVGAALDA